MMGQIQVITGWMDDPVRKQDGHRRRGCQVRRVMPHLEGHWMAGGEGRGRSRISM